MVSVFYERCWLHEWRVYQVIPDDEVVRQVGKWNCVWYWIMLSVSFENGIFGVCQLEVLISFMVDTSSTRHWKQADVFFCGISIGVAMEDQFTKLVQVLNCFSMPSWHIFLKFILCVLWHVNPAVTWWLKSVQYMTKNPFVEDISASVHP